MDTLDNPRLRDPSTIPYRQVVLRYGGLAALVLIVLNLLFTLTGFVDLSKQGGASNWIANIITWGVIAAFISMAMIKHRDQDLGGYISYGRAFMVGFMTTLVVALITVIWSYIYFALIDPEMLGTVLDASREQMMEQQNMDEAQVDQAMGYMSWMFTPGMFAVWAGIGTAFFGLIISLIAAAVIKKDIPANV